MNTNTVEQARKLRSFKIWFKRQFSNWSSPCKHGVYSDDENGKFDMYSSLQGPALALDELNRVFEWLHDSQLGELSFGWNDISDEKIWDLNIHRSASIDFKRTKNHAEDLASILIWMLEEKHITAEKVNEILK